MLDGSTASAALGGGIDRLSEAKNASSTITALEWKIADPEDFDATQNALPIDKRTNSGGHPIKAGKYAQIDTTKPESAKLVNYTDARGQMHIIPAYIAKLAESVRQTARAGDGILMLAEESAGIDLSKNPSDSPVNEVRAIYMQVIGASAEPFKQVQDLIEKGVVKITTGADGKPKRITLPAATDSATARTWIKALYGDGYTTAIELIASSQIGANIVTGARGEPRTAIPATKLTVIEGDGAIVYVTDPDEIDSWYGTQGYAGAIAEVEMEIHERPKHEEAIIIPMPGDIATAYTTNLPKIIAALYEYMYFANAHQHGIRIEAVEFMDITGCETMLRHSGDSEANKFKNTHLSNGCNGAVCLRLRHGINGGLSSGYSSDDPNAMTFLDKIFALSEEGLIGEPAIASNPARVAELLAFRQNITENARQEGKKEGNSTTSMDEEMLLDLGKLEPTNEVAIDALRIHVEQAMTAILAPSIAAYLEAINNHLHHTFYGHLRIGSEDHNPRNGGINAHDRVTGPQEQASVIKGIEKAREQAIRALDQLEFGPITLHWREGEKHNPNKTDAVLKAAENNPNRIARRAQTIERGGQTFGYRMPRPYAAVMQTTRERVQAMAQS